MNIAESKTALNRLVDYCRLEAEDLNLPFVAYCLSMASASLEDPGDRTAAGWRAGATRAKND